MTYSTEQDVEVSRKARLELLLQTISDAFDAASEEVQQRLLSTLQELARTERRSYARMQTFLPVTVDNIHPGVARNVGPGGVFIRTPVSLPVGQEISLVFPFFRQEDPIRMTGEIVWNSAIGIGVKFTSPLDGELKQMMEPV